MTRDLSRQVEAFARLLGVPVAWTPDLTITDSTLVVRVQRSLAGGDEVTRPDGRRVHRYLFLGGSGLFLVEWDDRRSRWRQVLVTSGTDPEMAAWVRHVVEVGTLIAELRDLPVDLIDEVRTRSLRTTPRS